MKSLSSPPAHVKTVAEALLILLGKKTDWKNFQEICSNPGQGIKMLVNFDKDNVSQKVLKKIQPYLNMDDFTPAIVRAKSAAAAGVCQWVISIVDYC